MSDQIKPGFIGTEDAMITDDGVFPLPESWREFVGFDAAAYWKQQDDEKRRQARLEKCELEDERPLADYTAAVDAQLAQEYEDDEIPDDLRFTLPGYDPNDFTDG